MSVSLHKRPDGPTDDQLQYPSKRPHLPAEEDSGTTKARFRRLPLPPPPPPTPSDSPMSLPKDFQTMAEAEHYARVYIGAESPHLAQLLITGRNRRAPGQWLIRTSSSETLTLLQCIRNRATNCRWRLRIERRKKDRLAQQRYPSDDPYYFELSNPYTEHTLHCARGPHYAEILSACRNPASKVTTRREELDLFEVCVENHRASCSEHRYSSCGTADLLGTGENSEVGAVSSSREPSAVVSTRTFSSFSEEGDDIEDEIFRGYEAGQERPRPFLTREDDCDFRLPAFSDDDFTQTPRSVRKEGELEDPFDRTDERILGTPDTHPALRRCLAPIAAETDDIPAAVMSTATSPVSRVAREDTASDVILVLPPATAHAPSSGDVPRKIVFWCGLKPTVALRRGLEPFRPEIEDHICRAMETLTAGPASSNQRATNTPCLGLLGLVHLIDRLLEGLSRSSSSPKDLRPTPSLLLRIPPRLASSDSSTAGKQFIFIWPAPTVGSPEDFETCRPEEVGDTLCFDSELLGSYPNLPSFRERHSLLSPKTIFDKSSTMHDGDPTIKTVKIYNLKSVDFILFQKNMQGAATIWRPTLEKLVEYWEENPPEWPALW